MSVSAAGNGCRVRLREWQLRQIPLPVFTAWYVARTVKHTAMKLKIFFSLLALLLVTSTVSAAQPKGPPRAPATGIDMPPATRTALLTRMQALGKDIDALEKELKSKPEMLALLPDAQIYYNAVYYALAQNTFYNTKEFQLADAMINYGNYRAKMLRAGNPNWLNSTGLVVRGYVSHIDDSVQPFGLVVPTGYDPASGKKYRLDMWFHGRDNKLTELKFINERQTKAGQFTPENTFVLHLYGRYCNASRFAGEVDAFEALAQVMKEYHIDENRISVRGFSMGGGTVWHMSVHHAGKWFAASPGAGFSDTAEFLNIYSRDPKPTWFEEKLWRMYDAVDYPENLYQCPLLAYSGEIDKQKLSADLMEAAMEKVGLKLERVIGKGMGHRYDSNSIVEIDKWMDAKAVKGREVNPKQIHFTTYTLIYNQMLWITVDGLEQHWEKAKVDADITSPTAVQVKTENVSAFTINMSAGQPNVTGTPKITVDGKELTATPVAGDKSWKATFYKLNGQWYAGVRPVNGLIKKAGLQGPIDHAFMDKFIFVTPTGRSSNYKFTQWMNAELADSRAQWWLQMRGKVLEKKDYEVTDEDIASANLILWGDAQSNKVIAKIMNKLPLSWDSKEVKVGSKTFPADTYVPVMIYPNPMNPAHYVVLNTGFTFAYAGMSNNANQYPRLPDYAVIDMTVPREKRHPAAVTMAGFFDENWKLVEHPE